jgi:cobalt-zinc-cadmium efflux system outer membrane protein
VTLAIMTVRFQVSMRFVIFFVGIFFFWDSGATGHAAPLTLPQALTLAEEYHPQLRAGVAQVEAAQAGMVTARAYPNPEFGGLGGGQTYRVPGNVSGPVYSFSLVQPLELGPLRPSRLQLAERGRESSERAFAGTRLAILSAVRRFFYQALRKREEIGLLTDNLRVVEDLRNRIQVRVDVGEVGRLELIRAEAEVVAARTAANSAQLQYVTALSQLRAAVAAPLDANLEIDGDVALPAPVPALDTLRQEVLDRHPLIALARAEVRRAEARLTYENALRIPQPSVRAEVDRPPDTPTYRLGIEFPLPLWNRREGPIAEASAQLRQAQALAQSREVEILAGLESAYGRYQTTSQQLAAFEQGLLREAEEALRAAQTAYQLGERGILEVLDAQRVLRTVSLDFLNARFDHQAARVDLDELRAIRLGKEPQ